MSTQQSETHVVQQDITPFCIIAIGNFSWGRGQTIKEAKKIWRKNGSGGWDKHCKLLLVIGDDTAEINDMGSLLYEQGAYFTEI